MERDNETNLNVISSTEESFNDKKQIYYQYIGFGTITAIVNCFILFMLMRHKKLLTKCAFIFGLSLGDAIHGLSLMVNGSMQIIQINSNAFNGKVHPFVCMTTVTNLYVLGNQLRALIFILQSKDFWLSNFLSGTIVNGVMK